MSIFKVQDIDTILIQFLSIDDLRNLYQVNTYYRTLLYPLLQNFIAFYLNYNSIILPKWVIRNKSFNKSVIFGNLEVCKHLYHKISTESANNNTHDEDISHDPGYRIESREYWLNYIGDQNIADNQGFHLACCNNKLDIAKFIYSLGNFNKIFGYTHAFNGTCENGHINMAKWLYSFGQIHNTPNKFNYDDSFTYCCKNNHIELAQWLISVADINYYGGYTNAIYTGCKRGNIDLVQWLMATTRTKFKTTNVFNEVFRHGFILACQNNHIHIAKFLSENIAPNYLQRTLNDAFLEACIHGHLDIAKWLYSIATEDIAKYQKNSAFKNACKNNYIEIAQWLCYLNPNYRIMITNGKIKYMIDV